MKSSVKQSSLLQRLGAAAWLVYFAMTICAVGFVFAYCLAAPLFIVGLFWEPADRLASRILCRGIYVLMAVQPWLSADIDIRVPGFGERKSGCLIVSNHRSNLDPFILLSRVAGIRILTKDSVFFVPFLGPIMRLSKQIPTRRDKVPSFWKAIGTLSKRMQQGDAVCIFPEMTRCQPGMVGTNDFTTAPFRIALHQQVPVIPVVFRGTDNVWPRGSVGLKFRRPVTALALEAIDSRQFTSAEALRDEARRRINEALA